MNKQEHVEFYEEIQDYLQHNNIHSLFSQLVQQIILEKPKNVLDFLIDKLEAHEKFTLFVVGPPGLSINSIIKKALANTDRNFELFNCGEEITKVQTAFKDDEKKKFNSCLLVNEEVIGNIIKKIEQFAKSEKNYIIEGFPKSLAQAHILQKHGIYARNVLVINIDDENLHKIIEAKITNLNPGLKPEQRENLITAAKIQHQINVNEVKKFYNRYLQIDLSKNREEQYIIKQLNKAFTLKTIQATPRTSSQIIIVGAPNSGRTTLGKKIASHYNFVYISTSFLIAEEIRKQSIHGRKIKNQFLNNQIIDNFLIEKLIQERVSKKDCRMQGFVLEGYPKNKHQYENIKNMKILPTMIVAIDTPKQESQKRNKSEEQKFTRRYQNWSQMAHFLHESKEKIFWVDPNLTIGNTYEEVIHEFEKNFI